MAFLTSLIPGAPSGLMGAQFVLRHRTGTSTSSATSRTLAAAAAVPVGNTLVVTGVAAAAAATLNTVTDPRGNTWTVIQRTTPAGNVVFLAWTVVRNAISLNDNVTLTFNAAHTRFAAELNELSGVLAVDAYKTNSAASTTTPTTGATAALARTGEFAVGVFGLDQGGTALPATLTPGANFNQFGAAVSGSTGTSDASGVEEYTLGSCQPLGTGAVTAGVTLSAGKAYAGIVATFVTDPDARARRLIDNVGFGQILPETSLTPKFRAAATSDLAITAAGASVANPGVKDGDLVFLCFRSTLSTTVTPPSGFTQLTAWDGTNNRVFWKIASNEPDTFTVTTNNSYTGVQLTCVAYYDTDGIDDWDLQTGLSGSPITSGTVTATEPNGGVLLIVGGNNAGTVNPATGFTERTDVGTNSGKRWETQDLVELRGPAGDKGPYSLGTAGGSPYNILTIALLPRTYVLERGRRVIENVGLTQTLPYLPPPQTRGSNATSGGLSNVTSLTVNAPTGMREGDFVLLALIVDGSTSGRTPPTGFTELTNSGSRLYVYTGTASATDVANGSFQVSWTTGRHANLHVLALIDGDSVDDFDVSVDAGTTQTHVTGSITTNEDNEYLVVFAGTDSAVTMNTISGWTELQENATGGGGPGLQTQVVGGDRLEGTEGPFTFTSALNGIARKILIGVKRRASAAPRRARRVMAEVGIWDTILVSETATFPTAAETVTEPVMDLSQQSVVTIGEPSPGGDETDTLDTSQTGTLTMDDAIAEALLVTQTGDQPGMIAEPGETATLIGQLTDALTAEKILETVALTLTNALSMSTVGDESDPVYLTHTNLQSLLEQVNGSIFDVFRVVQTLQMQLDEIIRSDIETLTVEQTNAPTLEEAADILTLQQQASLSTIDFLPVTIETIQLTETSILVELGDTDVVKITQTAEFKEHAATELANLVQTGVLSLLEIIDTPGSGFNENVRLIQTNLQSMSELILLYGVDNVTLTQTNVPTLVERILALPAPVAGNGIENENVIIPETPTDYILQQPVGPDDTTLVLVDATGLPSGGFVLVINGETVYVVSRDGNVLTVIRGWGGTQPTSHDAGDTATWPNTYEMVMKSPTTAVTGEWITMHDATQAYLDGSRFAWHHSEFTSITAPGSGTNKLDGPQPWRASPVVGVTDRAPGGVGNPARVASTVSTDDYIRVKYERPAGVTGQFSLGARVILPFFWTWWVWDQFQRYRNDGTPDNSDPNNNIYDGKSTSGMTYPSSSSLVQARELGADRFWTWPNPPGKGKSGRNVGVLVIRNGFQDVPQWSSPDWSAGGWTYMGFNDADSMFLQVVYQNHPNPDTADIYGPNATWDEDGFETSTAFAMFTTTTPPPGPPGPPGGGGGGGIRRMGAHIWYHPGRGRN